MTSGSCSCELTTFLRNVPRRHCRALGLTAFAARIMARFTRRYCGDRHLRLESALERTPTMGRQLSALCGGLYRGPWYLSSLIQPQTADEKGAIERQN